MQFCRRQCGEVFFFVLMGHAGAIKYSFAMAGIHFKDLRNQSQASRAYIYYNLISLNQHSL